MKGRFSSLAMDGEHFGDPRGWRSFFGDNWEPTSQSLEDERSVGMLTVLIATGQGEPERRGEA